MEDLEITQEMDDEFSRLWQRHLTALRDDFSATSVQALPSLPSESRSLDGEVAPDKGPAHPWDEKIDSVVDALDELALSVSTPSQGTASANMAQTKPQDSRDSKSGDALVSGSRRVHRDGTLLSLEFQLAEDDRVIQASSSAPSPYRRLFGKPPPGPQGKRG
jgi:hypothetical protein